MSNIFNKITQAFQSIETTCALANAQAKAYDPNAATIAPDDQSGIAMNIAGVYAADSAANAIAALRAPQTVGAPTTVSEEGYVAALRAIAEDDLDDVERYITRQFANVAWRAGQPFRGLARLARPVNVQFNMLPTHEVDKDSAQIRAAAKSLLGLLA